MFFKKSNKQQQSGRSMVEMLGVLAIIGVLSIGGIAGYTLAMRRHRANQIVDILNKYALISYSICQVQMSQGDISSITKCKKEFIPNISDSDIGRSNDINYYHTDGFKPDLYQKNGVDYVSMEIKFHDNAICKAVKSVLGSMASNNCMPGANWLTVQIPQN